MVRHATRTTGKRRRVAQRAAAVVMVMAIAAAGCGDDGDSQTSSDAGSGGSTAPPVSLEGRVNDHGSADLGSDTKLDLELDDSYFAPTFVTGEPGSTITVTLKNEGDAPHTFTIDDANIDEQVQPGATATVEVELPEEGSLAYYCRFHVSGGMQGAFVVSGAKPAADSGTSSGGGGTSGSSSGGFGY